MGEKMRKLAKAIEKLDNENPSSQLQTVIGTGLPFVLGHFSFEILSLLEDPDKDSRTEFILKSTYNNHNPPRTGHPMEKIHNETIRNKLVQACREAGIDIDFPK
ncbi:hypothetical protein M0P65_02975 [Candidatus Gracilibacteria bacterium]|nr:hypothetical protein [Candidatus Gracilibacteria bacterium]